MNDLVELGREVAFAETEPSDVNRLLPSLRRRHAQRITGELLIPARTARYEAFPAGLDARIAGGYPGSLESALPFSHEGARPGSGNGTARA